MRIGILGGGITGLSLAQLLKDKFEVDVLEEKLVPGGIARTKNVNGIAYHVVGGHCFNSKHQDVLDFVFNQILPKENWNKINRNSSILFKGNEIGYPIEYSLKEIFQFDKQLAINITADFLNSIDDQKYDNLEEWFIKKFGLTLSNEYFIPYNTKIWNKHPKNMDPSWVKDTLPTPDKVSFFEGLIGNSKDNMPHAEFYYPKSNNQNTFIDALANGLNIIYNTKIETIIKSDKWIINNQYKYDLIISTLPLNILPTLLKNIPENILNSASKLKYNRVSNGLWESEMTNKTWTYLPEKENLFHRYIHIGSFFDPQKGYTITETIGDHTISEISKDGENDPFLKNLLDHNTSEHAYVVFDENYKDCTESVKNYLNEIGINSIGRFGEWQYYNMDVCIKQSIDLSKKLIADYIVKQ